RKTSSYFPQCRQVRSYDGNSQSLCLHSFYWCDIPTEFGITPRQHEYVQQSVPIFYRIQGLFPDEMNTSLKSQFLGEILQSGSMGSLSNDEDMNPLWQVL